MNNENEDDFENPMLKHYGNPELNAFAGNDITIEDCKQNSRLFLTLTRGLNKNAIHNIMKQFGYVINIHIPANITTGNRMIAFVEYETFKEAEKALREINSSKNEGLEIHAEFAHEKSSKTGSTNSQVEASFSSISSENNKIVQEEVPEKTIEPIDLNHFKSDNIFEKVSNFNYKRPYTADLNEQKYLEDYAKKSIGEYNEEENYFEYDMQLRENFLTFYCRVCNNEASLFCESNRKYFCTMECVNIFFNNDQMVKDIKLENIFEKYQVQKLDKVCLTAIINEKCIFVRPHDEDYNMLLETVYRLSKDCQPLDMIPEVNDKVLVKHFESVYRAEILEVLEENETTIMTVRLTDVGNTIRVDISDVFEMTEECMKIKEITTNLMLKGVAVDAINMDVINYLIHLKDNNIELIVNDLNGNGAELKIKDTNEIINEQIVKLANFNDLVFANSEDMQYAVNDCVPVGNNQKLYVVNASYLKDSKTICCVNEKYVKDFYEFYRSLNAYGQRIDPEKYGIYDEAALFLVKYNNQWHRAVVNETTGDGEPECVLIDLYFRCKVKIENIFQIPKVLAEFPYVTTIYEIKDYALNEYIKKYCDENITVNGFIVAEKIEIEDNIPMLHFALTNNIKQ